MAEHKYKNEEYKSRIDGKHTIQYNAWSSMKQRCYDDKLHEKHPSYKDCSICEEWLDFQNFAKWFNQNYIEGYQLDKDLLIPGNKLYSPNTCCFIPQEINLTIIKPSVSRELPIGVYKRYNKYITHIKENKQSKYIGSFDTIEEASICYKVAKARQLKQLAKNYRGKISSKVYRVLINYNTNIDKY
jgi:hypothetical protein